MNLFSSQNPTQEKLRKHAMQELRTYQRRTSSRESGYHTCNTTTGGECKIKIAEQYECSQPLECFYFNRKNIQLTELFEKGIAIIAFGGYVHSKEKCSVKIFMKYNYEGSNYNGESSSFIINAGEWVNIGCHSEITMGTNTNLSDASVTMEIETTQTNILNFVSFDFRAIDKEEFIGTECAVSFYQKTNMHIPYLYFLDTLLPITKYLSSSKIFSNGRCVVLKSCNRCGRYLPINIDNEMKTLSFSLHCKKRAPCTHSTFMSYKIDEESQALIPELAFQLASNNLFEQTGKIQTIECDILSYLYNIIKTSPQIHNKFNLILKKDPIRASIIKNIIDPFPFTTVKQSNYLPKPTNYLPIIIYQNNLQSYHGHQLECKACKKFFVNAPLNPQRNAQQFKEDGLRRRAIEVLVNNLLQKNLIHFEFEKRTKKEFSKYIWEKFNKRCFKCGPESNIIALEEMALDHTLPLAYLYRLDETATCLCSSHNSQKSDHFPVDYYNEEELNRLSKITGLSVEKLHTREVNSEVLSLLVEDIVWFYDEFLMNPDYQKIRDGIKTADKINDSLKRVISGKVDLIKEYYKRKGNYPASVTIIP